MKKLTNVRLNNILPFLEELSVIADNLNYTEFIFRDFEFSKSNLRLVLTYLNDKEELLDYLDYSKTELSILHKYFGDLTKSDFDELVEKLWIENCEVVGLNPMLNNQQTFQQEIEDYKQQVEQEVVDNLNYVELAEQAADELIEDVEIIRNLDFDFSEGEAKFSTLTTNSGNDFAVRQGFSDNEDVDNIELYELTYHDLESSNILTVMFIEDGEWRTNDSFEKLLKAEGITTEELFINLGVSDFDEIDSDIDTNSILNEEPNEFNIQNISANYAWNFINNYVGIEANIVFNGLFVDESHVLTDEDSFTEYWKSLQENADVLGDDLAGDLFWLFNDNGKWVIKCTTISIDEDYKLDTDVEGLINVTNTDPFNYVIKKTNETIDRLLINDIPENWHSSWAEASSFFLNIINNEDEDVEHDINYLYQFINDNTDDNGTYIPVEKYNTKYEEDALEVYYAEATPNEFTVLHYNSVIISGSITEEGIVYDFDNTRMADADSLQSALEELAYNSGMFDVSTMLDSISDVIKEVYVGDYEINNKYEYVNNFYNKLGYELIAKDGDTNYYKFKENLIEESTLVAIRVEKSNSMVSLVLLIGEEAEEVVLFQYNFNTDFETFNELIKDFENTGVYYDGNSDEVLDKMLDTYFNVGSFDRTYQGKVWKVLPNVYIFISDNDTLHLFYDSQEEDSESLDIMTIGTFDFAEVLRLISKGIELANSEYEINSLDEFFQQVSEDENFDTESEEYKGFINFAPEIGDYDNTNPFIFDLIVNGDRDYVNSVAANYNLTIHRAVGLDEIIIEELGPEDINIDNILGIWYDNYEPSIEYPMGDVEFRLDEETFEIVDNLSIDEFDESDPNGAIFIRTDKDINSLNSLELANYLKSIGVWDHLDINEIVERIDECRGF